MLKDAGIYAILDHHALPGVSAGMRFFPLRLLISRCQLSIPSQLTVNQMFAGNCTSDIQFYNSPNDYNYQRVVTWSIIMAWLSHVHHAFETVFAVEAINEPMQDYSLTPGSDRCAFSTRPTLSLQSWLFILIFFSWNDSFTMTGMASALSNYHSVSYATSLSFLQLSRTPSRSACLKLVSQALE